MTSEEVIERLKVELEIPLFNGKIEDKMYSEEEYQKLKQDLKQYFDDYVRNIEN